jgi:hypothetical protein
MIKVATLEEKQPAEILSYTLDLSPINVFGDGTETISSLAWTIYDDADDPATATDLSATMIVAGKSSFTGYYITNQVKLGTAGKSYILRCLVTCSSGTVYEVEGRIKVKEIG